MHNKAPTRFLPGLCFLAIAN